MINPLTDKVALVTGGGRGLGEAICRALSQAGARVIAADVRNDLLQGLTDSGACAMSVSLDVSDESQVERTVKDVAQREGKIDILVNNAGVDVTLPVDEIAPQDWDRILRVNLTGPFLLSRSILPIMKAQGSGHIINIASTAAKRAWANASAYHASKWGLLGFSHALHVEARKFNVKVTALISGGMRTPFLLDRFPGIDVNTLQDPKNVADSVVFVLQQPLETVIPEMMVIPMTETSWP